MANVRPCPVCGNAVPPKNKYLCSASCANAMKPGRAKGAPRAFTECQHCRRPFRLAREDMRWCSPECVAASKRIDPPPPSVSGATWIPLGRALFALVDLNDAPRVEAHLWCASGATTARHKIYAHRNVGNAWVKMHVDLMLPPPGMTVDHINGETLDNRRANLRVVTAVENNRNRKRSIPLFGCASGASSCCYEAAS